MTVTIHIYVYVCDVIEKKNNLKLMTINTPTKLFML